MYVCACVCLCTVCVCVCVCVSVQVGELEGVVLQSELRAKQMITQLEIATSNFHTSQQETEYDTMYMFIHVCMYMYM